MGGYRAVYGAATTQRGQAPVFYNAATTGSGSVTFPMPYPAGTIPIVVVSATGGDGNGFVGGVSNLTNTGFTILGRSLIGNAGPGNVIYNWIAVS